MTTDAEHAAEIRALKHDFAGKQKALQAAHKQEISAYKAKITNVDASIKAARTTARDEAHARIFAVVTSDLYAGREATAHSLLEADMSAEAILGVLSTTEKGKVEMSAAQQEAFEKAGREEMLKAIYETGNSDIDATGKSGGAAKPDAQAMWDKALAKIFPGHVGA